MPSVIMSKKQTYFSILSGFNKEFNYTNTILYYEGDINHEITKSLTLTTENRLIKNNEKRIIQKKVFNIMVESLQNIDKHSTEPNSQMNINKGAILISNLTNYYSIITGNIVTEGQVKNLKKIFNNLKDKEKIELRFLYKSQLENGRLSDKGGAGLGFIDMARKACNPLKSGFYEFEKGLYLFVLEIIINKNL